MFKAILTAATLAATTLAQAQAQAQAPKPASAPAQTAPAPAAPSAAKKELVARVLKLQQPGLENFGNNVAAAPLIQMRQQIGPVLQQRVPADKREALAREIEADMRKYYEEASPITRERAVALAPSTVGALLAERFNEAELKQIVATLESPVQRKFLTAMGEAQRTLSEQVVAESRAAIEPKVRALQESVSKRLSAAVPGAAVPGAAASAPRN
jgi:uncharacterized protein